ncbi:MAG: hypothetical protein QXD05_02110 [Candidatus Pacearchaeota archaeon]
MIFLFEKRGKKSLLKSGQISIFILVAVVILSVIVLVFLLRGSIIKKDIIPKDLEPVYNNFLQCIKDNTETGISILGSQGGYINLPNFEPGSQYMPFSSYLNFLGNPIPYWYYVSGNNIKREQVPTKKDMEKQLETYILDNMDDCNFETYYREGFEISMENSRATVKINENNVEVELNADLTIKKSNESVLIKNHRVNTKSRLGSLYNSAKKIYDYEQKTLFLEEYGIDILRLYSPVDGFEITCSPKVWNADEVFKNLQEAIEENTYAIKTKGDPNDYFKVDVNIPPNEEVRFINSRNWPYSFEVSPTEGNLLIANPVGNQQGLGIIGFCYVPYHFVYDVKYPILVQVQSGSEIFQFPLAVVIQGNKPREPLNATPIEDNQKIKICDFKNTEIKVSVKDKYGNPIQADISYECLENTCFIGKTSNSGELVGDFPQCVNGFIVAKSDKFKEVRAGPLSTVSTANFEILMEKIYEKQIQLNLDGVNYNGDAIIYFISDDLTQTIVYPTQKTINLSQGQYEIQVYIFRNSSLTLGAMAREQCFKTAKPGLLGVLGFTEDKCFNINIPSQVISQALSGGGKQNYFISDSELTNSNKIEINAKSLPIPDTIEKLQNNYILFEDKRLDIKFR